MKTYKVKVTDTLGRLPNYSYVLSFSVKSNTLRGAITKAKREAGLNIYRHAKEVWSGIVIIRPRNVCEIMFIEEVEE